MSDILGPGIKMDQQLDSCHNRSGGADSNSASKNEFLAIVRKIGDSANGNFKIYALLLGV